MPIYRFMCSACGHVVEEICKVGETWGETCPRCGQVKWVKLPTTFASHFHGDGWTPKFHDNGDEDE